MSVRGASPLRREAVEDSATPRVDALDPVQLPCDVVEGGVNAIRSSDHPVLSRAGFDPVDPVMQIRRQVLCQVNLAFHGGTKAARDPKGSLMDGAGGTAQGGKFIRQVIIRGGHVIVYPEPRSQIVGGLFHAAGQCDEFGSMLGLQIGERRLRGENEEKERK